VEGKDFAPCGPSQKVLKRERAGCEGIDMGEEGRSLGKKLRGKWHRKAPGRGEEEWERE